MGSIYRRNRTPMMYCRESRNALTEKEAYEHDEGAPTAWSPANTFTGIYAHFY